MDYIEYAMILLNSHIADEVRIQDTGYESYNFEVEEIDIELIPEDYQKVLNGYSNVMTHLFAYEDYYVYILQPYGTKYYEKVLIGLMKNDRLIDYKIILSSDTKK